MPTREMSNWRAMTPADLDAVMEIADVVHPDFPEDRAVFANRLALFPAGCLCLEQEGKAAGYLVSHPAELASPPPLDCVLEALPVRPDCYYIHDLALLPGTRGSGAGRQAATRAAEIAQAHGFAQMGLIAVNNSAAFWKACGFAPVTLPGMEAKLASYGDASLLMSRHLPA